MDRSTSLIAALVGANGIEAVSDAIGHRTLMSHDVYRSGDRPVAVVRPTGVATLQATVRVCAEAGVAVVPRGGGASYTDGYLLAGRDHVVIDTGALDAIEIDVANAAATVGAGVTWAALDEALRPHGLRTPFWGPFSGMVATIGGSVSQNAVSHGSAAHGISAESLLSLDVVLANGELLRTGAAAGLRHFGPDLTGLFCGDCGALGIKATLRLPLIARRAAFEGVSFAFADFAAFAKAGRVAQIERVDDEHFGLDLALSQGQIARQEGAGSRLAIAARVLKAAPNPLTGLKRLAGMGLAGAGAVTADAFMWHFIVEGVDTTDARARATRLRTLLAPLGREIANSVPNVVKAMPFAKLYNVLGPAGERWVPLHGVLAHDAVPGFHDALLALYAQRAAEMTRLGVWQGGMFSPVGSVGFLYEIALYWPDARSPFHEAAIDADHLATVPSYPAAPEVAAFVDRLKRDIVALYAAHGAGHFQIGRAYPYLDRLDPTASALLRAVKAQLDPEGIMNPGVLGL